MENTKEKQQYFEKILNELLEIENQSPGIFEYLGEVTKLLGTTRIEMEVEDKCGKRYERIKPEDGRYSRWGKQAGSLKLGLEKLPVFVPRIKDKEEDKTFEPEIYKYLRENAPGRPEDLYKLLIRGLSQKDYKRVAQSFEDSFGLSQSSVSNNFIEVSSKVLEDFENRSLENYDIMALFVDGKSLKSESILHCLGVTKTGYKVCLGFVHTSTENSKAIKEMFRNLIERGLNYQEGLLIIADGGKGIAKAAEEVFKGYYLMQRCQWHKRENVVSHLKDKEQEIFRYKLQQAYDEPEYEVALSKLNEIHTELKRINHSAAKSLREGLQETLTLHRLGLRFDLGRSLTTTNCIESLNNQLRKYLGRINYWKNGDMLARWVAASLLKIESSLRRIHNYKKLHLLRIALKNKLELEQKMVA